MTLYRFHGRITVEREESLSHLLYERMSIMYKVELKFDTSKLAPETVNQMCEQADQIFEQEDLSCAVKALGSRIYLDRGRKQDYGRFWAAENLLECFWYNGTEKENLITDFIRN